MEKVSIGIILDAFDGYLIENRADNKKQISRVCVAPQDQASMNDEYLYICSLSFANHLSSLGCHYCCLCPDTDSPVPLPENAIVVRGLYDFIELVRIAQDRFEHIRSWLVDLNDLIQNEGTYQELTDRSEYVFGNPIYIVDGAFKLIANTKHIMDDAEQDIYLRENNQHSESFLKKLGKMDRLSKYQSTTELIVSPAGGPNIYTTITKWIWDSGMPALCILMVCYDKPYAETEEFLMEAFCEYCERLFRKSQENKAIGSYYYDSLFKDMLFDDLSNTRGIYERAQQAGISMEGNYEVYTVILKDKTSYPLMRLGHELNALLPGCRIILRAYHIIILNSYPECSEEMLLKLRQQKEESVIPLLQQRKAICGISGLFRQFTDFKHAYLQSVRSIDSGTALAEFSPKWQAVIGEDASLYDQDTPIYRYDDNYYYYLIHRGSDGNFDIQRNTPILKAVQDMIREDIQNNTSYAKLLYTYLNCERNAARTGEKLHMHRNNVLYHLPKIEARLHSSLEDPVVRYKIMTAFYLVEMSGAFKENDMWNDFTPAKY